MMQSDMRFCIISGTMNPARAIRRLCFFLLWVATCSLAQDSTPRESLAELAAHANANKSASPRVVLDDDSMETKKPVIPDVFSGALDNTEDIERAITEYRKTHTRNETEEIVHEWYTKHDDRLANAIAENRRIEERQTDRQYLDGYRYAARNQREYEAEYEADLHSARDDYSRKKDNGLLSARIQQTFMKVRSKLQAQGMNFEWFKIRCGNGNCSY
jgi:hypothetical protein